METNIYEVKSVKGVHLECLHQELTNIIGDYSSTEYYSKIQQVPVLNCLLLTTENHKLVLGLIRNDNYTIKKVK